MSTLEKDKKNIVFLSSNASQKYITDYLETIAAPDGLTIHYRYQNKWVDEKLFELLAGINEGISSELKDKKVLLCHLLQFQPDLSLQKWDWRKIFPLRSAIVKFAYTTDKKSLDGVSHFYFELANHIYTNDEVNAAKEFDQKLIKRIINKTDSQVYAGFIDGEIENLLSDSSLEGVFYKSCTRLLNSNIYPSKDQNLIYYKPVYLSLESILKPDSSNPRIMFNPQNERAISN